MVNEEMTEEEAAKALKKMMGPQPIVIKKAYDEGLKISAKVFEFLRPYRETLAFSLSGGGSPARIEAGYFGYTTQVYEIEGEGVIGHRLHLVNPGSHSHYSEIYLLGFNEEGEVYQALKKQLEEIAAEGDEE